MTPSRIGVLAGVMALATACDHTTVPAPENCGSGVAGISSKISAVMIRGRSADLVADAFEGTNAKNSVPGVRFNWTSTNRSVVEISGETAIAKGVGSTSVTASACGRSATVDVTVIAQGWSVTFISPSTVPTTAVALNDSGHVVGTVSGSQNFLWRAGSVTDLGTCAPVDVNDSDEVLCAGGGPTIWKDGVATARDTRTASARFLNDAGHVLLGDSPATFWRSPTDTIRIFLSTTSDMSDMDYVSGSYSFGSYNRPSLWHPQTPASPSHSGRYGAARGVNDHGDATIIAECSPMSSKSVAQIWIASERAVKTLRDGGCNTVAVGGGLDLNNQRQVVGVGSEGAFVWSDGNLALLAQVIDDADWQITKVKAINNRGQILAEASNSRTGQSGAILLDPP